MYENNKKENTIAYIMYIIIGIVLISVVFIIFMSNKNLITNNSDENTNSTQNEEESNNNNNNNSNENKNITSSTENNSKENDKDINITKPENKVQTPVAPIETEIASYTTTLYDKEQTRIENINLAISKLNDVIIENGAEFSFNNTIGPMDESNGFKKATGFDTNGKKIKISGGGICQISSTLYNTALIANFTITERHPHSRRVYYVPKDKDATIYYGSLDLKFVNNSGSKVKINASATASTVTIKLVKIT